MGYYSHLMRDSELVFRNGLTDEDIAAVNAMFGYYFQCDGITLIPNDGDAGKMYTLEEDIQELVKKHPADGMIGVTGEDNDDIWRLLVDGSTVTREDAIVTWPNGEKVYI